MATAAELSLVDTNILVEALYRDASHHQAAAALLDRAQEGDVSLCVVPQVLSEFYAVVTDARRVTPALTPEEALDAIGKFLGMPGLTLLPVPVDVVERWMELVRERPVTRGDIFDVQLVASMLGHGVRRIYTFNVRDFKPFAQLEVLSP